MRDAAAATLHAGHELNGPTASVELVQRLVALHAQCSEPSLRHPPLNLQALQQRRDAEVRFCDRELGHHIQVEPGELSAHVAAISGNAWVPGTIGEAAGLGSASLARDREEQRFGGR